MFALLPVVSAAVVTLDATASGTYHSNGSFFLSGNYAAGWFPSPASPPGELRDFFVFNLTGVTGPITAATLRAFNPSSGYSSPDANETWTLFDVSTSLATLTGGGGGLAAFNDLGSGTSYGSATAAFAANANVDVALNAAALAFLNSASGSVAIGGAITSFLNTDTQSQFLFNSTNGSMTRQLILTTAPAAVPEPGTLWLIAAGAAAFLLSRASYGAVAQFLNTLS
jgi:PEP-CTERM motif